MDDYGKLWDNYSIEFNSKLTCCAISNKTFKNL